MKVYFTASISHRKNLFKEYSTIISTLKELGAEEVFSEDILDINLKNSLDDSKTGLKNWHTTWVKYIQECDFAVAEISYPSTINVGFEIGNIIAHGKPVIGLYKEGKEPIFTNEPRPKRLIKSLYTLDNIKDVLSWAIEEIREIINRRFTFLVPPDINEFLENANKTHKVTASDLIRRLVRKEMIASRKKYKRK